jgi:NADPH2:quinone reductase
VRAIQIAGYSGPEGVRLVDVPEPDAPADGRAVRVAVMAAGVTFPEVLQTRGAYQVQPDLPFVPGGEIAGLVDRAPEGSDLRVGDRVFGYCATGGFAERAWLPLDRAFRLPDDLSFVEGAALFANFHTAWFALVERGRAVAGDSVLVHGAGGGVGTACVQVARTIGLTVIAVVSDDAKAAAAQAAGAHHVLLRGGDWRVQAQSLVPGGVDLVVDPVGGDVIENLRVLRELGRLLIIGFAGGDIPSIPANRLLLRNLEAIGIVYGSFAAAHAGYSRIIQSKLDPLLAGGLRPIIGSTHPIAEASLALAQVDERRAIGKVVLDLTA